MKFIFSILAMTFGNSFQYDTKAIYDELYVRGYHSDLHFTHSTFLIYELLDQKNFPNHTIRTILDVGCSHGKAVEQLWKNGKYASGVDISSVAVKIAKKTRLRNGTATPM